jgi:hypothetical protein
MAQATKPNVTVPGDSRDRIMARSGELVGRTKTKVVWRFGFLPESDAARAYGVSTSSFLWVKASPNGRAFESYKGFATDLPQTFQSVIDGEL